MMSLFSLSHALLPNFTELLFEMGPMRGNGTKQGNTLYLVAGAFRRGTDLELMRWHLPHAHGVRVARRAGFSAFDTPQQGRMWG